MTSVVRTGLSGAQLSDSLYTSLRERTTGGMSTEVGDSSEIIGGHDADGAYTLHSGSHLRIREKFRIHVIDAVG